MVLPCYNPVEGWVEKIRYTWERWLLAYPGTEFQLIVVNDGSTQQVSNETIQALQAAVPGVRWVDNCGNHGKGHALRTGIRTSQAPITLFTDIDFPYTLDSIKKVYEAVASGQTDVAVGIKDADYYSHLSKKRVRISRFLRSLSSLLLHLPVTDTQCGLKAFNAAGREVFLQTTINRYLADLEFIYLISRKKDLRLIPVEVSLRPGVVFSQVRMEVLWREGLNFLRVFFSRK